MRPLAGVLLGTVMNDVTSGTPMLTETPAGNQSTRTVDDETDLEQQMAELGLSNDTRRFLRNLHLAEKQINDAFNKSREGGELEERVSQVYRDLYGAGCAERTSRR
jgi:hypothetical protein